MNNSIVNPVTINHSAYSTKLSAKEIALSCGPIQLYAIARLAIDSIKIAFQGLQLLALKCKAALIKSNNNPTTQKIQEVSEKILATKESLKMDVLYLGGLKFATEYQRKLRNEDLSTSEVWGEHAFQELDGLLRKLIYPLNFSFSKHFYPYKESKDQPKMHVVWETTQRNTWRFNSNNQDIQRNNNRFHLQTFTVNPANNEIYRNLLDIHLEDVPRLDVNNAASFRAYNEVIKKNNDAIDAYNRRIIANNQSVQRERQLKTLEKGQYILENIETTFDVPGKNRKIEAFQYIHKDENGNDELTRKTVVIFGGNGMTGGDCAYMGKYYFEREYNVIMPTVGGYPGSSKIATSEQSTYEDVETVKRLLEARGVRDVGYHGLSIGGSLAMHAAVGNSATTLNTTFVVLDQTFTSASEVTTNVAHNSYGTHALDGVVRGAYKNAFPKKTAVICDGLEVELDGLDNLKKMEKLKERNIPLIAASATYDAIMGRDRIDTDIRRTPGYLYTDNFANDLLAARYPDLSAIERARRHIVLNCSHCELNATDNRFRELDGAFYFHGI